MDIAPGISDSDWKDLDKSDWDAAISIFERRLRGRFIDVADFLIAEDEKRVATDRRFGFAILALDCLLVETLQAFREGLVETNRKSTQLFVSFLTGRPHFKNFFQDAALATRFYKEFRCGLLHNAQVFGTGRVWSVGPLIQEDNGRLTVNRTAFHAALVSDFDEYLNELRADTHGALRQNFRTKMDFIADGRF